MNVDRLHSTVIDLCRIPSPSRQERRVAEYVRARIASLGLAVVEDDAGAALGGDTGNLFVSTAGGRGVPIFLCAHMDTVAVPERDPIPVVVETERIHTGGVSPLGGDDKAGVALALELLAEAVARPADARPLDVIFCVQEEIGCRGSGRLDPARVRAREGFVLDGETAPYTAIREAPTKDWFRIAVTGRRAHAAVNPEDGRNAVVAAGALAVELPGGRIGRGAVANVGSVSGGGPTNVVPDRAEVVGELRCLRPGEQQRWRRRFERIAARVSQAPPHAGGRAVGANLRRLPRGRRRALRQGLRPGVQSGGCRCDLLPFHGRRRREPAQRQRSALHRRRPRHGGDPQPAGAVDLEPPRRGRAPDGADRVPPRVGGGSAGLAPCLAPSDDVMTGFLTTTVVY